MLRTIVRTVMEVLFIAVALLMTAAGSGHAAAKSVPTGMLYAASDGQGTIRMLVLYPFRQWPAGGWRIEEADSRRVVKEKVVIGSAEALRKAGPDVRRDAEKLIADIAGAKGGKEKDLLYAFAMGRVLTDWDYAQALNIGLTLADVAAGRHRYRAVGLDAKGQSTAMHLESAQVDSRTASPLPVQPGSVTAASGAGGVSLFWQPDKKVAYPPVLGYRVQRTAESGSVILTTKPIMVSTKKSAGQAAFIDREAPVEQQLTYTVTSIDALGRESRPSVVEVFHEDLASVAPPIGLKVEGDARTREVSWELKKNDLTSGYLVERSSMAGGPYEILTPAGLPAGADRFRDTAPPVGDAFYRLRAVGPRGNVGQPSDPVLAPAKNPAPPRPEGLRIEPGRTRILITWQRTPGAVGYVIERRIDEKTWSPLNSILIDEPRYEDHIGMADGRRYEYRVSAVAYGDAQSRPGDTVGVTLPDAAPPAPPRIVAASGAEGRARITFEPAPPEEDTASFLILRSGSEKEVGLVLGDPLSGKARSFEDAWVNAGDTYWYRLVSLDAAGNRSEPGPPVAVRIGSARIPSPSRPAVTYRDAPFARVVVAFDRPPAGLSALIEAKAAGETRWRHVAGPLSGTEAVDAAPPRRTRVSYRVIYQAADDSQGQPSDPAEIALP